MFSEYNYIEFNYSVGNNQNNQIIMGIIWDLHFLFYEYRFHAKLIDKLCLIQFISV